MKKFFLNKFFFLLFILTLLFLFKTHFPIHRAESAIAPHNLDLGLNFSNPPLDTEFLRVGLFSEPLIPVGKTNTEENRDLAKALVAYRNTSETHIDEAINPLLNFLQKYPESVWKPSLLLNLGMVYRKTGHFSKAFETWQFAWNLSKNFADKNGKAIADATVAQLSQFEAYLGRKELLKPLLEEIKNRPLNGSAAELVRYSSRGLYEMENLPEISFKCGPMALSRILLHEESQPNTKQLMVLEDSRSTPQGLSLTSVQKISSQAGMNYQMAYRSPSAVMVTPAVAHWKVGHYAALLNKDKNRYAVEDPTFGENIRISDATLNEEASGYFLVPPGPLPKGWRTVSKVEGNKIWGRGNTGGGNNPGASGSSGGQPAGVGNGGGTGGGSGGAGGGGGNGNCPSGCTTWDVDTRLVSLVLHDVPLKYTPPYGQEVKFEITYSQRDVSQPQVFSSTNFGPKWISNWQSHIVDNVNLNNSVVLYPGGGGFETFRMKNASQTMLGLTSQTTIMRLSDSNGQITGFMQQFKDGSYEEFMQKRGNEFFLSARADPQGNKITVNYDNQGRIVSLKDAIGQVTTFLYELANDPLKVTKITDPFGRSASFVYVDGKLVSGTDALDITSNYSYGSGDFINTLQTPYGTTHFTFSGTTNNAVRWIEATDSEGHTSRVEFRQNAPGISPQEAVVPVMSRRLNNNHLQWRNTFVWNAHQYALAKNGTTFDYTKAKIIHYLHTPNYADTSSIVESIKEPNENRVWYLYAGQPDSIAEGANNLPINIARVLDDGITQSWKFDYNEVGNVTEVRDPSGHKTRYEYASNGIDVVSILNTTGGRNELLESRTYNQQHEPLSIIRSNGATYRYEYNSKGQRVKAIDPLDHVTSYSYDAKGYLVSMNGPQGAEYSFTRDSVGRIASATDTLGRKITYSYDNADRVTETNFPDDTRIKLNYHLLDLEDITNRLGQTTRFKHDSERRITAIIDPLGQVTKFGYNAAGALNSITDPKGQITSFTRDLQGRVVQKQFADGSSQSLTYESAISRIKSFTDALNQQTLYTYHPDNTLVSVTPTHAAPVRFTYDAAYPRLVSMTDGVGTTTYTYYPVSNPPVSGANRLQSVTSPVSGTSPAQTDTVVYTYDALGRVVGQTLNGVASTKARDPLGRITAISNPLDTFNYTYADATARVTEVKSAHGPQATFNYFGPEGDGLLHQMNYKNLEGTSLAQLNYTYDANHNLTQFSQGQGIIALTDADHHLSEVLGVFGLLGSDDFFKGPPTPHQPALAAALFWMLALLLGLMAGILGSFRRTLKQRVAWMLPLLMLCLFHVSCSSFFSSQAPKNQDAPIFPSPQQPSREPSITQALKYSYDAANRLLSAQLGNNELFAYTYDANSNPTSIKMNGEAKPLLYSSTNGLQNTQYDANGNPTLMGETQYKWDGMNRLVGIVKGNNESNFTYDGKSHLVRMIEKQNGNVVSDHAYTWCGNTRCLERDNLKSGSPVSKQYFSQGLMMEGQAYYYLKDRLGSVLGLLDASGKLRAQYTYDPYGNRKKINGDLDSDLGFTGLFYHAPSGLNLALYRAYDSANARWLNRDPIQEFGGMNLYGYVGGNPVNRVDGSGLIELPRIPPGGVEGPYGLNPEEIDWANEVIDNLEDFLNNPEKIDEPDPSEAPTETDVPAWAPAAAAAAAAIGGAAAAAAAAAAAVAGAAAAAAAAAAGVFFPNIGPGGGGRSPEMC